MKDDKKKKNTGAGFYIALCCCVAAMGIVGFVNSQKTIEEPVPMPTEYVAMTPTITLNPLVEEDDGEEVQDVSAPKIIEEKNEVSDNTDKISVVDENTDVIELGEDEEFYDGEVVPSITIADKPRFIMPVDGEICNGFSGDKLIYDSVMGDFRTHNGIDIKAEPDTDVVAAADGVIESVYVDTVGNAIIIDHGNGYKTKYANLDDIQNLESGMELSEGDFIAHVGTYAYGESTTEPHIHFEIIRDDEYCNPEDFLE